MAANAPDSFFQEQVSIQEEAERTEPEPVYLSADSEPEKEEAAFTSGAPGFSSLSSFQSAYAFQNPAFETRHEEIQTFQTVLNPEEDRKLPASPSCSSSQNESDSEFEIESEVEKKPTPKVKLVSKALRVKRNVEHGLQKPSKKAKKGDLWKYTEQKLAPDLVVQILPITQESFVFKKIMTMVKVEDVSIAHSDTTLLTVLNKFRTPNTPTVKLRDIQTEKAGFVMFRRVVVRKEFQQENILLQ